MKYIIFENLKEELKNLIDSPLFKRMILEQGGKLEIYDNYEEYDRCMVSAEDVIKAQEELLDTRAANLRERAQKMPDGPEKQSVLQAIGEPSFAEIQFINETAVQSTYDEKKKNFEETFSTAEPFNGDNFYMALSYDHDKYERGWAVEAAALSVEELAKMVSNDPEISKEEMQKVFSNRKIVDMNGKEYQAGGAQFGE